jgi:hypothetical protein
MPPEVAEVALAHTLRDKTEAAYQRGDLLEKRRRLWRVGDFLCAARSSGLGGCRCASGADTHIPAAQCRELIR